MSRPLKQVDDEIRELNDDEYAVWLAESELPVEGEATDGNLQ